MRLPLAISLQKQRKIRRSSRAASCRIPIRAIAQVYKDAGLRFDGTKALPANLVRPFPGLAGIRFEENVATSNFNSLQVSVNRRFSRGFSLQHRLHLVEGARTWRPVTAVLSTLTTHGSTITGCLDFDRAHAFVATYVYDLPKFWAGNWATTGSHAACSTAGRFRASLR